MTEATSTGGTSVDTAGAVELLFKVANATVAAVAYEASCSNAAACVEPVSNQVTAAMQTPQKQRTAHALSPSLNGTDVNDDDSFFDEGAADFDDDDDGFLCIPSPSRNRASNKAIPCYPKPKNRRNFGRQDEYYSATSRRAPPRSTPAMREMRPPLPPPTGTLKALPAEHVQNFLKLVQDGDYGEALRALRKVRRAVKGRGCSKEAFGGLRALLHHLLEGYAASGRLTEALELLEGMKNGTESRLVSAAAFNAVLRGLLARASIDEARFVVREEMSRLGVSPNEGSLNLLMDTAARAGPNHLEEAWDVLEEMQKKSLRADKYTVSILTKSISERDKQRRIPRGVQLVEHFLETQSEDVDEVLVNSVLDVFCRMGDMLRLEATLTKMREYGIKGSAVTYGTIVKAYGKAGNIDKVLQAWSEMSRLGLEANSVTYGCMLDACVKCGHLEKALQVFAIMKEQNLHRNTILYATLIKGFAKSKDPLAAKQLYQEMKLQKVQCNVVVYNSLIDACVRANDLQGAAEILKEMSDAGVQPDLITFSTLIKGYCNNNDLQKAMRLAEELRRRKLECDEIVYNSLLEGCVKAAELQLGLQLFTEMRQAQVRPSSVTFSILVKLLSRAGRLDLACHLVAREMREMHGVTPTRMVWSCLITCCVKARDLTRAVMVLDLLDREGGAVGSARTSLYATVIEGCLQQGEVGIALALCDRAYSRVPPEPDEASRGVLSADLLRRVFESVGLKGPEAEARTLLDSISSRLSGQVRASLEESLTRGATKKKPSSGVNAGGRDGRGSVPRVGVSEASNIAASGIDALLSTVSPAANGGVLAAASLSASQPWPTYMPSAFAGVEAPSGMGMNMWDPATANAAIAAAAGQWPGAFAMGMPGMDPYAAMYGGYGAEQYYAGGAWPWPQNWHDSSLGASWAAAAAASADQAAAFASPDLLLAAGAFATATAQQAAPPVEENAREKVADTPQHKSAETPSTASGGPSTMDRTPATNGTLSDLHSPIQEVSPEKREEQTPVNMRLFANAASCDTVPNDGKITPMRVEVPLSALLDGPPGLH